jgi:hypothetical protein
MRRRRIAEVRAHACSISCHKRGEADSQERTVGKAEAEAAELSFGTRLDLQAPLRPEAVRLRAYSVQWLMNRTAALMGPFREPWEFGYLMVDATKIDR